ncbi:DUF2083 domain-containing protein [Sphingomonas lacunae]|uniref:DUF2083 domain-containing protein n=1 Tax=Sphingomonas lacunae TaxID=2698828 RepID=A0A6M4APY2_9SPHN|nr:helix-turn-helix transcriptional regulator [Sphingomonas lacunae]QJQ31098.1 DUF2083 domain-containing protein [Sphingomonas lacunae]
MAVERSVYLGPRLKRLRRELGLTQAEMAADLEISPSYIALIERNQRPLTADILLRLARTYRLDVAELAVDNSAEVISRLRTVLKDPIFSDIDLPALEIADVATNFPGITEALLRLHGSWQQEQATLADRIASADAGAAGEADPVAEARNYLASNRNSFPQLDDLAEVLAGKVEEAGGPTAFLKGKYGLRVRFLPSHVMVGSLRRYDRHRSEILLDETLDSSSRQFQLALQIAYLEWRKDLDGLVSASGLETDSGRLLIRRSLASYAAAAFVMPYGAFAKAAEVKRYDIEVLGRQFGTSFEQTAHRLTTLQRPGSTCVPFFFLRVDQAGNVSKRMDGAGFPFARHGGACPLWSVHQAFLRPRSILTQWLELPDGQRFFSIARTVTAGGGAHGAARVERAIALGCAADHAPRLVYADGPDAPDAERPTPIGVSCRLCQRPNCAARSAPPIGRQVLPDEYRRTLAPFGFSD